MKQLLFIFAFLALQTIFFTAVKSQNATSSFDLGLSNSSLPPPTSSQNLSLNSSLIPSIIPPTSSQNLSLNSSLIPSVNLTSGGVNASSGAVNSSSGAVASSSDPGVPSSSGAVASSSGAVASSSGAVAPSSSGVVAASSSGLVASSSGAVASSSGVVASSSGAPPSVSSSGSGSQSNSPSQTPTSTETRSSSRTGTNSKTATSACGNGIKDANEECEGGECCSHRCRYIRANKPCGFRPAGTSPACVKKRRCNGLGVCRPAVIKQNPKKRCTKSDLTRGLCDITTGNCV